MKIVILTVFSLILFTDARATDDAKSQEDSYMPTKVQQLAQESMVATKPANRYACFNCEEKISIISSSTPWYLLKTLIHTGILGSSFITIISSHEITIIFSSPS